MPVRPATRSCTAASCAHRILAPDVRGTVHPPTALVCWQVRGPRTAPMAAVLRHHPGGARQAAQACSVGESGACPHHSPASRYHHAAHPQAALCAWHLAGDHWTLRWKLFFMAAKRQRAAVAWRRAGARAVRRAHASVCTEGEAQEGPRSRSGRRLVVEPADPRCLAGPPGPITELGGLWSPWVSSRVRV